MKKNFLNEDGEGSKFKMDIVCIKAPCPTYFNPNQRPYTAGQDSLEMVRKIEEARKENEYNEARKTSFKKYPYVYAGIGLIVILLIARMVTKK
jgi:hypothetical protein